MSARARQGAVKDQQLDLPFASAFRAQRSNGAEPLAVRIPDAVRMTGIGRSKLYELIASGDIETVKVGRCTLVPMESLRALLCKGRSQNARSNGKSIGNDGA